MSKARPSASRKRAGSLARILGPIFATTTLHYLPPLPYSRTVVLLGTAVVFAKKMGHEPAPAITAKTTIVAK
jgi:hypothetical protein